MTGKTALVLAGSGAKAAWQVGVLQAVSELLGAQARLPTPIMCASSTGALNAALLACEAECFAQGIERLRHFWRTLEPERVFRGASRRRLLAGLRLAWALVSGRSVPPGFALLDLAPLARWLAENIAFDRLDAAIDSRALHALAITCSGYHSGQAVTFFQGRADLEPWQGARQVGAHIKLGVEHFLATMALPLFFPAVKIHREWFGDGALRPTAPLSPALHLGAERILLVGCEYLADAAVRVSASAPPTAAQLLSHLLGGWYADTLAADLAHAKRLNRAIGAQSDEQRLSLGLEPIEVLAITPSERLEQRAIRHAEALPSGLRRLLESLGGLVPEGSGLMAQLAFAAPYTSELLELGYRDASARRGELAQFFGLL